MAIRTVVTRGFGNGTYNGTIALAVTRGYAAAAILIVETFIALTSNEVSRILKRAADIALTENLDISVITGSNVGV